MDDKPLDHISVAPPEPENSADRPVPEVREGKDAADDKRLERTPDHPDAKLDVELDASFPSSDPPASSTPGSGDPAPSSGYDEEAERKLAETKE